MTARKNTRQTVYNMTVCALMAALMCVLGPMSILIGVIPVTFTNLVIYLAVILLGMKMATVSCCVYLFIGIVGMPVFSGYSGGVAKLAGPTGGFLVGFIFLAVISGLFFDRWTKNVFLTALGMALGTLTAYLFGTMWFVLQMQCTFLYALEVCVLPFLVIDAVKIAVAIILGKSVRLALKRARLLPQAE